MIIKDNNPNLTTWKTFLIIAILTLFSLETYQTFVLSEPNQPNQPIDIYEFVEKSGFNGVPVEVCWNCSYKIANYINYETTTTENAPALYDIGNKKIILRPNLIKGSLMRCLWHEYGHFIWYEKLNTTERYNYITIYEKAEEIVTPYALEGGVEEDFAETVAYYKLQKFNQIPKERKTYMSNLVKDDILI